MVSDVDESFLASLAAELRSARIEAIVVGNVACILSGAPVLTQDVDLLVRDTPLNRKKLKRLAAAMGGVGPEHTSGLTSTERIYGTDVPIDILYDQMIGGLKFAAVRSRAYPAVVGREVLTVAALADVIKSKTAAGRPKDKAVLPVLRDTLAVRRAMGLEKRGT
jgi:hypothetical protein